MSQLDTDVLQAIANRALAEWDLAVKKVKLISISENVVFRIDTEGGEAYALRIHRPGYHSLGELVAEQQWTAALNEAGIRAPVPKMARNGNGYATVSVPDSTETRQVGVIEWLDGVTLSSLLNGEHDGAAMKHHFDQLGHLLARMHNQAVDWQLPADFERVSWDAEGLMGDTPIWGRFWELPELTAAERDLILRARRMLHERLLDYGTAPEHYSIIHADLNPDNCMIDGEQVSVIDFDDSGFGWHAYDLAVVLYYDLPGDLFETARDALLGGYRLERSLDDSINVMLPMFLLVRGLVLLGWMHERPEQKHDARLKKDIEWVCKQAERLLK